LFSFEILGSDAPVDHTAFAYFSSTLICYSAGIYTVSYNLKPGNDLTDFLVQPHCDADEETEA
jgi:ABC-type Zn2+ transport system substrate-binding protein/surface adhesin